MYSIPRFHECRKLEGYKFPVYSTEFCPRNETEWNKRSSALRCNETNGYTCLPNERFTELLEFCYTQPRILIEAGLCLVLVKNVSLVHGYKCHGFIYGCPSSPFLSSSIFEYPTCIHLRNGCFFAEPTCKSKQTHLQDTTDVILKKPDGKTTPYPQKTTKQTEANNDQTNNNNSGIIIGAVFGATIVIGLTIVSICIIRRKKTLPFKKNKIRQWKRENSDFYSTKACKDVEQRIKNQSVVMVIGHPGTGKSAIIQHIALQYKNERWILEPLQSIIDFEENFSSKKRTLYIINDPFGKNAFKKKEWEFWRDNEEAIESSLTKSCSKMLMSCQKYIFLDIRIQSRFKDCPYVVDITEVECKLTNDEKRQLIRKYTINVEFATDCAREVEIEAYFPRLCKLYSKKGDLNPFLKPEEVLNSELKCLREENRELFCALIVLAISDDNFCMEHLQNMSSTQSKCISDECGINGIAPFSIKDKLDSMDGFLVKKKNSDNTDFPKEIYMFYNKNVQEIIESCFKDIITRIKKKV